MLGQRKEMRVRENDKAGLKKSREHENNGKHPWAGCFDRIAAADVVGGLTFALVSFDD